MKGISQVMLITACMLTGPVYAMEIVPEEMQTHRAEIATAGEEELQPQVATLVKSESYTNLNAIAQAQEELESFARTINNHMKDQQTAEEEVSLNAPKMANSMMLDQKAFHTALTAKAMELETQKLKAAAIRDLEHRIAMNADSRGSLFAELNTLSMDIQGEEQTLLDQIANMHAKIRYNTDIDSVTNPISQTLAALATALQAKAVTTHRMNEKEAQCAALKQELAKFKPEEAAPAVSVEVTAEPTTQAMPVEATPLAVAAQPVSTDLATVEPSLPAQPVEVVVQATQESSATPAVETVATPAAPKEEVAKPTTSYLSYLNPFAYFSGSSSAKPAEVKPVEQPKQQAEQAKVEETKPVEQPTAEAAQAPVETTATPVATVETQQ